METGPAPLGARHPSIQRLRRLSRRRIARQEEGAFVIDGPVLLAEALDAGIELLEVLAEPSLDGDLAARAHSAGVQVRYVQDGVLAKATDTVSSQGVATIAASRGVSIEHAVANMGPLALVLVSVTDPGNAGTLVRTAEASGAGAVLFCDGSVDAFSPKCVRAAAGALFRVEVANGGGAVTVLEELGRSGIDRVATGSGRGTPYHDAELAGRVAVVLGSEAHGLPAEIESHVDRWITIPMAGRAESLNVGVAGAIVSFEALRQRRLGGAR